MTRTLKRLKRGFTLVELMIVVAIVGILAALAIYGVSKYVKNAKTAEARDALGRMAKDAISAYNKEGMAASVLTLGQSANITHRLCGSAVSVPATAPAASKYQSSPADWNTGDRDTGWTCLKFSMNDPQYFQYAYTMTGAGTAAGDSFACEAHGDLDGDTSGVSTFSIAGNIQTASGKTVAVFAPNIDEVNPDE